MDIDISTMLDITNWERLQLALAKVFDITVIVLDYKGNPVTPHSNCSDFCRIIRSNTVARRHCFKCAALAGLESVRHKGPFIYRCNCGIINAAIPVMLDDRYLGAVLIGQVRPTDSAESITKESLIEEIRSFYPDGKELNYDELMQKYNMLPEMSYERFIQIGSLVQSVVQYITARVVHNRNEAQTYEWMLRYAVPPIIDKRISDGDSIQPPSLPAIEVKPNLPVSPESSVFPAVNYVETHRKQMIGMHEMALLCHLSPSYFSKLFLREVGENFTDWVNHRKVDWAKEMLHDSSKSVTAIASELGYMDTSYFIKVFKKFVGSTPLVYRQHRL